MQIKKNTFRQSVLLTAVRSALALGVVAGMGSAPVYAAEEEEAAEEQKVIITGSRIRRDEFGSPSPIQILTTEDAKKQGINTIAAMLQRATLVNGAQIDETINTNSGNSNATEAPPSGGVGSQNVGLRGLGAERTLILVNGRRLGSSGVRGAPSQPDLSLIPFDMVDRVEILSDAASAIYGADAVAGVINVILKDSIDGVQFSANFSSPTDPGGETRQMSFVTGAEGDNSSFVFGAEFFERERVALGDRLDCIRRLEQNADTGERYNYCYNSFPDNTAIVLSTGSQHGSVWNFFTPGQSNTFNDLTGNPIANWSGSANIPAPNGGYADFIRSDIAGNDRFRLNPNYNDNQDRLRSDLVQPVKRFSLMASGTYNPEWGQDSNVEMFYDTSYFHRHQTSKATIEQIFPEVPGLIPMENGNGGFLQNPDGSLQLFENEMNPFGANALPVITLSDLNQDRSVELDHFRAGIGLRGDLPFEAAKNNGWTYEVAATYDRGDGVATQPLMNENHLSLTLNTLRYDSAGNVICGVPFNDTDTIGGILTSPSCVPVDFFSPTLYPVGGSGGGSFATAAERDYLIGDRVNRTVVEQTMFSGFVTGDLFEMSGGTSSVLFGFEHRRDAIDSQVDMLGRDGLIVAENPATEGVTAGSRTVQEFFGEITLPILSGHDLAEELSVDLAVRYTDESNFGTETTERVRVLYAPNDWMTLSTAYGTSFRAPNLREQFLGDQFGGEGGGSDPCNVINAGNGWDGATYTASLDERSAQTLANCNLQGVDPSLLGSIGTTTIPVRTGGNVSDLSPETAEQLTVTFKATPIDSEDYEFDFGITYFDIKIEDTIQSMPALFILQQCLNNAPDLTSPFCGRVGPRSAAQSTAQFPDFVDASFTNIGEQTSVGYDINTRFAMNLGDVMGEPMKLTWINQLTIQDELTTTIIADPALPNGGTDDTLGTHGSPENRLLTTLSLQQGDFTLTYTGRYISSTDLFIRDPATSASTCLASNASASTRIVGAPNVYRVCTAESAFYSDLALSWTPSDDFGATIGIRNLTDEDPAQVSSGLGNDRGGRMVGTGYDQIGQTLFVNMSYKF